MYNLKQTLVTSNFQCPEGSLRRKVDGNSCESPMFIKAIMYRVHEVSMTYCFCF